MNILIVKLTSMGDLIHTLPAITDACQAISDLHIDWVADESFAQIPQLHPRIEHIITTGHRRWKKKPWYSITSGEIIKTYQVIRQKKYDLIIDAQGNLKSAVITAIARGMRVGMDKHSVREKFADCVYQKTLNIPKNAHAIYRQRQLFANALGYTVPNTSPEYGILDLQIPKISIPYQDPYLVFIHSTTWPSKHWPEIYWGSLIQEMAEQGYSILLPWGSTLEKERAERLAQINPKVHVLPRFSILEQAAILKQAAGVVSVDTGLGHLSAALNVPSVHLYGPTDPAFIGAIGKNQVYLNAKDLSSPIEWQACQQSADPESFMKLIQPHQVSNSLNHMLEMPHE